MASNPDQSTHNFFRLFQCGFLYLLLWPLFFTSCTRPIAVTHWDAKGVALIDKSIASAKKDGYGYPKHNQFSRVVCFNNNCINRAETINRRKKYRFKGYKNNKPIEKPEDKQPQIVQKQAADKSTVGQLLNKPQTLKHVYFETGKAQLQESANEELEQIVNLMKENPTTTITVSGHTDNVGEAAFNLKLSQERAEAVIHYLETHGIAKNRLSAKGYGSSRPVTDNLSQEGRDQNRRVEFIIIEPDK